MQPGAKKIKREKMDRLSELRKRTKGILRAKKKALPKPKLKTGQTAS